MLHQHERQSAIVRQVGEKGFEGIAAADKVKIVAAIAQTQQYVERQEENAREREQQLEVMSLLGVVAGFMTHEFGVALQELEHTHKDLVELAKTEPKFAPQVDAFSGHIRQLKDFVTYSSGYIQGSKATPAKPYPVRPRLQQVKRVFGKYAEERNIDVEISAEPDLAAAAVPVSLYNGIALNLYTNALKAVTAKVGTQRGRSPSVHGTRASGISSRCPTQVSASRTRSKSASSIRCSQRLSRRMILLDRGWALAWRWCGVVRKHLEEGQSWSTRPLSLRRACGFACRFRL